MTSPPEVQARAERAEAARLTAALDAAVTAMLAARQVVASKQEHALLAGAIVLAAEAKADVRLPRLNAIGGDDA
jgi:hypothetical protein